MTFLIVSKQDSETGANNYTELEIKYFKDIEVAQKHVNKNYDKGTNLYKLNKIPVKFRKEV